MNDVLKSGYFESNLDYDNVDWFVDEVIELEKKMAFCFENTNKLNVMTQEDEEHYRDNNVCRFCEENIESDKVRDLRHLTGKHTGPAHNKCNNNVTQKQSIFFHLLFTVLVVMIVILFSKKKLVVKKMIQ